MRHPTPWSASAHGRQQRQLDTFGEMHVAGRELTIHRDREMRPQRLECGMLAAQRGDHIGHAAAARQLEVDATETRALTRLGEQQDGDVNGWTLLGWTLFPRDSMLV
jgi:hypothetical protein